MALSGTKFNEASFGQLGSILHESGDDAITADTSGYSSSDITNHDPIPSGAVFVAITFLEDSAFESSNGLVSENQKKFINSQGAAAGIDLNGGIVTGSTVFPKGLTIYGRWTQIDLSSGKIIAYIGY